MMNRKRHWALLFTSAVLVVAVSKPAVGLLVDMAGHWSAPLAAALEARGIISGDEYSRFDPEGQLTRAQLAKMLVTGTGYQEDAKLLAAYPSRYSDIPKWHWANGYVESLAEMAAVEGYPDGTFGPEDQVTRAQMAVILVRMAGLANQARVMRFETTGYRDDSDIPSWARGHINVARAAGLMDGKDDGSFRPLDPITRAEGSVAIFRLLNTRGRMFNLTGTLVRFDPTTRKGTVRDEIGQEQVFTMSDAAQYYRKGLPSVIGQVRALDQVWIVLGSNGEGTFMDARFQDALGRDLRTAPGSVTATLPDGTRTYQVQSDLLAFLNGKPATLAQVNGAQSVYMIFDQISGRVRVLDAVMSSIQGKVVGIDQRQAFLYVQSQLDRPATIVTVAANATLIVDGTRGTMTDIRLGDQVQIAVDEAGFATYVLAER
jgi:hypothetical protein